MSRDKITIRLSLTIGLVRCERTKDIKVDREDWEEMDGKERDDYMLEELLQVVDWGYEEV